MTAPNENDHQQALIANRRSVVGALTSGEMSGETSARLSELWSTSGRLVFWERADHWGLAMLRQMQRENRPELDGNDSFDVKRLAEQAVCVTSIERLRETLETHPASFVIAETSMGDAGSPPKYRELLARIPHWRQTMPLLRLVVLCFELPGRSVDEYDVFATLFREAGCSAVLTNRRELSALTPSIHTHFANLPQRQANWRESIEQRLPWRKV